MPQKKKVEGELPTPNFTMDDEPVRASREGSGLRLSTIIHQEKINPNVAAAVMRAHGLTPRDRMEAGRFKTLVDNWLRAPAGGK